jgi:spoIIIJ-associated protein
MDKTQVIKEVTEKLLNTLQISATVVVLEQEGVFQINLETEESGLLIGYHGETLSSLQLIVGLMVYRRLGEWVKVIVEVGDYRAKKMESLAVMANDYADRVASQKVPIALAPMSPFERRAVHMALTGRSDVETVSDGEGSMRHIVIKPV